MAILSLEQLKKIFVEKSKLGQISQTVNSIVQWANISGKPTTFDPSAHTHVASEVTDLNEGLVGTKEVDETGIADEKILEYDSTSGKLIYVDKPSGSENLNNYSATTAPTTGDDSADGYSVGSVWINLTTDKSYQCVDSTIGSAVWTEITNVAGAGTGDMQASVYDPATKAEQVITIGDVVDEDDMTSNSDVLVPTQQSVKAYVDNNSGGYTEIYKTTAEAIYSDTTLSDDNAMVIAMDAGTYHVKLKVRGSAYPTPDFKWALHFTGTGTLGGWYIRSMINSSATYNGSFDTYSAWDSVVTVLNSAYFVFLLDIDITVTVTVAGTFSFQWAQNTSSASPNASAVNVGTYLEYKKIA